MDDPAQIPFEIQRQPDDVTCGPTCLHALYRHYGEDVDIATLVRDVDRLETGGTLGVLLANHALARGYRATLVTWNLRVFDPTWFQPGGRDPREGLLALAANPRSERQRVAARAYAEFLERGGNLELRDLEPALLRRHLRAGRPILTGLSATFLYRNSREIPETDTPDDLRGEPVGHFVVLTGYRPEDRTVLVSDPLHPNPLSENHTYPVSMQRLIGAIYLGVLTYDGNLVLLEPPDGRDGGERR